MNFSTSHRHSDYFIDLFQDLEQLKRKMECNNLAKTCNRFPMIADMIFKNCNDKSLVTCKMSSRNINTFIREGRFFWLRQMGRYNKNFQGFRTDWNKTIIQTSTFILMQLAEAIHQFYAKEGYPKVRTTRNVKTAKVGFCKV